MPGVAETEDGSPFIFEQTKDSRGIILLVLWI